MIVISFSLTSVLFREKLLVIFSLLQIRDYCLLLAHALVTKVLKQTGKYSSNSYVPSYFFSISPHVPGCKCYSNSLVEIFSWICYRHDADKARGAAVILFKIKPTVYVLQKSTSSDVFVGYTSYIFGIILWESCSTHYKMAYSNIMLRQRYPHDHRI